MATMHAGSVVMNTRVAVAASVIVFTCPDRRPLLVKNAGTLPARRSTSAKTWYVKVNGQLCTIDSVWVSKVR